MSILISEELKEELIKNISVSKRRIDIVTAFCKVDSIKFLEEFIPQDVEKRLLVRFRLQDLIMKSSDIELYDYCKEHNWKLFIDTNLHAKVYLIDDLCFIGSANLTGSGLSINRIGNIEGSYKFKLEENDEIVLEKLFSESVELTDDLYNKMLNDYNKNKDIVIKEIKWNEEINKSLEEKFDILLQQDFPINNYPDDLSCDEIYLNIKKTDDLKEIKKKFEDSKIMRWLINELNSKDNKELYFGEVSEKLHSLIFKEPKIYRIEVKELQKKMYNWLIKLNYEYLEIDTPVHSTRIRLIK